MRSLAVAAWCILATAPSAAAATNPAAKPSLIACNQEGCSTTPGSIDGADFVWLWSAETPPLRASAAEAKAILARGLAPETGRARIRIAPRDETPLQLIAAPIDMWREVPESLLPRFDVPKSGVVSIPRKAPQRWSARLVGKAQGSWWTPLESGVTTITPLTARTATLRVVDTDGAPLAAAAVAVAIARTGAARSVVAQQRADKRGVIALESLPDLEPLTLVVSEKRHAPESITERVSALPETITLRRGADVTARFIDADEKPVQGALVRAEAWLPGSGAVVAREAVSGADGSWRISALPAGTRAVVFATARGFGAVRREVDVAKSVDLGTILLDKGQTLEVRVVEGASRAPIAGARVRVDPEQAVTSEKGVAQLTHVASSPVELVATAEGYLSASMQLAPPFERLTEIELTRAFTVTGRFTGVTGQPIAGATARVLTGNSSRDVTLDEGAFRISLQPDQPASIEFASPSTRVVRIEVEGAPGDLRDLGTIRPEEGAVVRGRVVTADGSPVASASIWMPRAGAAGPIASWATGDVIRAQSDPEGAFVVRGAGPEPALLRIDGPGFARAFRSVTFDAHGGDVDLGNVVLTPGGTVRVRGRPEAADAVARLVLRPESGEVDTLTTGLRHGAATIRNVPAGRASLAVIRNRSTICEQLVEVAENRETDVDCTAGSVRVRGSVFFGQRPAEGGTLVWTSPHTTAAAGVIMNNVSRLGATQQQAFGASSDVIVHVASDGRFESDDLRPGAWLVRWMPPDGTSTEPREITIAARPEIAVVLRYDDAVVRGIVVDERSRPVRQASVRQLNGRGFAVTGDDGAFAIAGLTTGPHRFRAEARALRSDSAAVTIEAGRTPEQLRLVLRRSAPDALALRVRSVRGTPAAGALVFVETSTGQTRILTTGIDGRATLSFEDDVAPSLRVAAFHEGTWALGDWQASSAVGEGITLTIGEAGALAIFIEQREGELSIRAPIGWDLRMLMTRIGWVPIVNGDGRLQISGLPPGTYEVAVGASAVRATVRRGETTTITIPR